jgi:pimeloyl-ACP methyl ester carboxylesterase
MWAGVIPVRARSPDLEGSVQRDGLKIGYEVFGSAATTVLLAGPWPVAHSRMWKAQVPHLARHFSVITVEPRGNGRADRPTDPAAYTDTALAGDLLAVLDALDVERAVLVGHCVAAWYAALVATAHPDRVLGLVLINPTAPHLGAQLPHRSGISFDEDLGPAGDVGWSRYNRHSMRRDYRGYLEFYFDELIAEPHSSKQREDAVGWGLETNPDVLVANDDAPPSVATVAGTEAVLSAIRQPTLVITGDDDRCIPPARGARYAELIGAEHLVLAGAGHLPHAREPVAVNRAIEGLAARFGPPRVTRWVRPQNRQRRVLYLSSPIGLGHVRRDLAVARELRFRHPDLRIDWLAQPPVAGVLTAHGERVHPASAALASEAAHIESEAGEHDLPVFEAFRRMDEILVANFMVFADLVRERAYDLWVGDEAWELDHFLHENPELKRSAYAWFTDFVGWLPTPGSDTCETALIADVNAEMLDQVERLPRVRDRAIFVGDVEDVVPAAFGPGLPAIRDWAAQRYEFSGYISDQRPPADRHALRARLGYRPDEQVCLVTVGGSGVGRHLLRRVAAAHPIAARQLPGLRTVVVTGPRIDPRSVPAPPGVRVHGYLPELPDHLAACDIAVVQGGLATTMELTAAGRPFIYVPLGRHCEQAVHVAHRLRRHHAGRELNYTDATPHRLAELIVEEIARAPRYRPVPTDGAARAAAMLADLL